jgi:hypothetical protein
MRNRPILLLSILNPGRAKWKWLVIFLLAVILFYGTSYIYGELNKLPPEEAVQQSLVKTLQAESYRFQVIAKRSQGGNDTLISDIHGEKSAEGVHLQGSIPLIKADLDLYYLGETIYRKDAAAKNWVVIPAEGRVGVEQLIAELNPLGVFNFPEGNFVVREMGTERIAGKSCRVYEVMTKGENKYLELFWQDFNYILWVDKKKGLIRQARIMAEHRERAEHTLRIDLSFTDYNVPIELKAPFLDKEICG